VELDDLLHSCSIRIICLEKNFHILTDFVMEQELGVGN